ncbi:unnamed protein product [Ranitomeya imitator]|uniref:Helix-turn-helix domain-containing protein n=1 Tax=Ranitomeya imitator TaxID=111125 RepID=A0ABN9L0Y7_9NEOB|nr:unnamed protein product [Ranitomeya imitator]
MEKWENEICQRKVKKYHRDVKDYEENRVFRWQWKKNYTETNRQRQPSFSSFSSTSETSTSSLNREPNMTTRFASRRNDQKRQADIFTRTSKNREDNFKVINLSNHSLTDIQLQVLAKGLTFSPSKNLDPFVAVKDLHLFSRKIVLKRIHYKSEIDDMFPSTQEKEALADLEALAEENSTTSVSNKFPISLLGKSKRFPSLALCPAVDVFTRLVTTEIENLCQHGYGNSNCSRAEREAIDSLANLADAVFKPSDKGGNIVIWPNAMYERQALRLLNDKECYRKLTGSPMQSFQQELIQILEDAFAVGIIPQKFLEIIKDMHPRLPTLYLIPKIHKDPMDPPGRPIISGNGGLCEVVTKIIDHYLKPLVSELPSYIQDTNSALRRIEGIQLHDDAIMVTADVEALYTSIRHKDGLKAVRWFLDSSNMDKDIVQLLMQLLEYALTHNIFIFKNSTYLQLQGTAMGASCAPSYANLFLGAWEREVFVSEPVPHSSQVSGWMRYIDDIWFIWEGTVGDLTAFMNLLNDNKVNVKLTFKFGRKVEFLDLCVSTDTNGNLYTNLYRKPTATNAFLHATSSHPQATIRGIPVGQFLRAKRICTNSDDFIKQSRDLADRFQERGYSRRTIRRGFVRASKSSRVDLLYGNSGHTTKKVDSDQVRLITTFHNKWYQFREIINKHWDVLFTDPILRKMLPKKPQITARRSKNLSDTLVHSFYDPVRLNKSKKVTNAGFYPCGLCKACLNTVKTKSFTNFDGTKNYEIRKYITCSTRGVIYHATCPCGRIYVGLTTRELKIRIREHCRDIERAKAVSDETSLKTLPRHFRKYHACSAAGLVVRGIDAVNLGIRGGDIGKTLAQVESRWIYRLGTMAPQGLNETLGFGAFL